MKNFKVILSAVMICIIAFNVLVQGYVSIFLSAICPLRVQKLSEKQDKRTFVICSKMAYFRAFLHIAANHEKCAEIFDSRTGHHKTSQRNLRGFCFMFFGKTDI